MVYMLFSAGEMLSVAEHFLEQQMHPTVVISAYRKALDDMISTLKKIRYWRWGPESGWCQPGRPWKTDLLLGGKGRPGTSPVVCLILQGEETGAR